MSSPRSQNHPFEPVMSQNNLMQSLDPCRNKIRFNLEIGNLFEKNKLLGRLRYKLEYIIEVNF